MSWTEEQQPQSRAVARLTAAAGLASPLCDCPCQAAVVACSLKGIGCKECSWQCQVTWLRFELKGKELTETEQKVCRWRTLPSCFGHTIPSPCIWAQASGKTSFLEPRDVSHARRSHHSSRANAMFYFIVGRPLTNLSPKPCPCKFSLFSTHKSSSEVPERREFWGRKSHGEGWGG